MKYADSVLKYILIFFTISYSFIWILLHSIWLDAPERYFDLFSDTYGIIALISFGLGLFSYKKWGGSKSILGKSIMLFSLGLLFQFGGQASYAYYRIINGVEVAYPSFGEIFYFGSIPIYIFATWKLLLSLRGKKLLQTSTQQMATLILITVAMLSVDYFLILHDYEIIDYGGPTLTIIGTSLDYAYPITQSLLVSLAIFAYFVSRTANGGMLTKPILIMVLAMYLQYLADTLYTYRVIQETYYGGDYTDMIYIASYFTLGMAFIKLNSVQKSLLKVNGK